MEQQKKKTGQIKKQKPTFWVVLVRNIGLSLVAFLLVFACYKKMPGYEWVYADLLKSNMQLINQYKDLPIDSRNEMKLGYTYAYLRFITQQTPENAVIFMPGGRNIYFPENQKTEFTGQPYNKLWATRFLYPRKIVLEGEEKVNKYADKITHVAIVNGWGYDKLNYTVESPAKNTILPINR